MAVNLTVPYKLWAWLIILIIFFYSDNSTRTMPSNCHSSHMHCGGLYYQIGLRQVQTLPMRPPSWKPKQARVDLLILFLKKETMWKKTIIVLKTYYIQTKMCCSWWLLHRKHRPNMLLAYIVIFILPIHQNQAVDCPVSIGGLKV